MSKKPIDQAHEIFASRLLDDFVDEITGRNIDRVVVMKQSDSPEEKFFVGKLLSINEDDSSNKAYSSKTFIQSMGVDFFIDEKDVSCAKINVFPKGEFYYRAYPTLEEQRMYVMRKVYENTGREYKSYNDLLADYNKDPNEFVNTEIKLVPVYKKLPIENENFSFNFRYDYC